MATMQPETFRYYSALAERIFFQGIAASELAQVAKFRPGKAFKDLEEAVRSGRWKGLGKAEREFYWIAQNISDVIEIDISVPFDEFGRKLRQPAYQTTAVPQAKSSNP